MGYFIGLAIIQFVLSFLVLVLVVAGHQTYPDAADKDIAKLALIAMLTAPLAGFLLPIFFVLGLFYTFYLGFRMAFID